MHAIATITATARPVQTAYESVTGNNTVVVMLLCFIALVIIAITINIICPRKKSE